MLRASIIFSLALGSVIPVFSAQSSSKVTLAVSHLEMPEYPPLAHMVRMQGTVKVTVEINERGDVIAVHAVGPRLFVKNIEATQVRTWKFTHLPAGENFPIRHTIRFEFRIKGEDPDACPQVIFDLPDQVLMIDPPPRLEVLRRNKATVNRKPEQKLRKTVKGLL